MGLNGGMRELSDSEVEAGASTKWMPYFTAESAASTTQKAMASGGSVLSGPSQLGAGVIAVLADPTGAVFGLFEGDVDD